MLRPPLGDPQLSWWTIDQLHQYCLLPGMPLHQPVGSEPAAPRGLHVGGSVGLSSIERHLLGFWFRPPTLAPGRRGYFSWAMKLEMAGFVSLLDWKLPRGEYEGIFFQKDCYAGLRRKDVSWEWTAPLSGRGVKFGLSRGVPTYPHTLPDLMSCEQPSPHTFLPQCSTKLTGQVAMRWTYRNPEPK